MSNNPFSSGAWRGAALISEDFINGAFEDAITSESPNSNPDSSQADTNRQVPSVQIELCRIFDQLLPDTTGDRRARLTGVVNAFAQVRERVDALQKRDAELKHELDEHSKTLAFYCECFAVANRKVAQQDGLVRLLVDEIVNLGDTGSEEGERLRREVEEAQEKLTWLAAESGKHFAKVYKETDAMIGKKAEMRMGEAELRRVRARALEHQTKALAIARVPREILDRM